MLGGADVDGGTADPVEAARAYSEGGADEIAFLDITATVEERRTVFDVVAEVAEVVDVPLTVGGGIKSCEDIEQALVSGVTRASISSAAFRTPDLVGEAVERFGSIRNLVADDHAKPGWNALACRMRQYVIVGSVQYLPDPRQIRSTVRRPWNGRRFRRLSTRQRWA